MTGRAEAELSARSLAAAKSTDQEPSVKNLSAV
jgi:hypothetical protein